MSELRKLLIGRAVIVHSSVANYYYVDIEKANGGKDDECEKGKDLKLYRWNKQRAYKQRKEAPLPPLSRKAHGIRKDREICHPSGQRWSRRSSWRRGTESIEN